MFFDFLTKTQRKELLLYCYQMAMADQEFTREEKSLLAKLESDARIKLNRSQLSVDADITVFDTRKSRAVVAMTVLLVALIDRNYEVEENRLLDELTSQLGLGDHAFNRLTSWTYEYKTAYLANDHAACAQLRAEGRDLLSSF